MIYNDRFELKLKIGFKTINNVVDIILFSGSLYVELKQILFINQTFSGVSFFIFVS